MIVASPGVVPLACHEATGTSAVGGSSPGVVVVGLEQGVEALGDGLVRRVGGVLVDEGGRSLSWPIR